MSMSIIGGLAPIAGAAIGAFGSKGGGGRTSSEQVNQDMYSSWNPGPVAPHMDWLTQYLQQLMGTPQSYYPGQGYVGPSDMTKWGLDQSKAGLGTSLGNYNFLSNAADVANNPYVQGQLKANERSVMDTLKEQMLPQLQSGAVGVNNLGSSRLGLAQGQAMGDTSKELANTNAATMLNAYGQGLGAQQYALGQTSNLLNNLMMPGQQIENYHQRALDDQMARWQFAQNEPWNRMGNVSGLLGGALGRQGTARNQQIGTSTGPNPNYMSPWQGALGGAQLGYGLYQAGRDQGWWGAPQGGSGGGWGANAPLGYNPSGGGNLFLG